MIVLAIVAAFLPSLSAQGITSTTTNDVISQMRSFRGTVDDERVDVCKEPVLASGIH